MQKNILILALVSTTLFPATTTAPKKPHPTPHKTAPKVVATETVPDTAFVLDGIVAIVFSPYGTEVVTDLDTRRSSLTGEPLTLEKVIFERAAFLDAQKYHMVDDDAVDRYLATVQRENNLTLDQLKQIFSEAGYSYEEGREQFKRLQTVNTMMEMKIRSNLIVPRAAVEEYYQAHPQIQQASYYIQRGFVPFSSKTSRELQKQEILQYINTGKGGKNIQWDKLFWIDHDEVADDKAFIFTMQPDQISEPVQLDDGFEIFRLTERKEQRITPLEEQFKEIVEILRRPKFDELMEAYKKHLFDPNSGITSILYFNTNEAPK